MYGIHADEETFIKSAILALIETSNSGRKPQVSNFVIGELKPLTIDPEFNTSITLKPNIHSEAYFGMIKVKYTRFNIGDYRVSKEDKQIEVPAIEVQTKAQLINYMNELYLHSVTIQEKLKANSLYNYLEQTTYKGKQIELKLENLKDFVLNYPSHGIVLIIEAKENSYLFTGSLRIKFV